jgi:hypothetical protein
MAPRLNYNQELGRARAHAILNEKYLNRCEIDDDTGCWLFTGSLNTDGYGQIWTKKNSNLRVSGHSSQTAFLLHKIAYLAANGHESVGHTSHLCDRPRCFNPDHLADETATVNNARKGCAGPIICSKHGHIVVDLCPHIPRCIRPPREDVNCCLAIKESDPSGWHGLTSSMSFMSVYSSEAANLVNRMSSEFDGAEHLEEAVRQGLL